MIFEKHRRNRMHQTKIKVEREDELADVAKRQTSPRTGADLQ
jgi:hypothetical protein